MADFIKIPDKPALYQAADTENIKAVVGGVNTDYFAPSANVSFKMQSGVEQYFFNIADDIDQVKTIGKAETLTGDKLTITDGDVESTFTLSETSLKIERVFFTKPTVAPKYKLAFSPEVQFFYQGELTAEEIAEGCSRPDNVVGSYAVYCDKQGHYKNADGTTKINYGCGKIGHLYAPYWTDSSGKKIKGTQEIVGNVLTFALPDQGWIDSAVLPITLDPDIGYTTAGASTHNESDRRGVKYTTGSNESGTLAGMSASWRNDSGYNRYIELGLYVGGTPGTTTAAGEILSSAKAPGYDSKTDETNDFLEIDFSAENYSVLADTDYWLTYQFVNSLLDITSGDTVFYYDTTPTKSWRWSVFGRPWTGISASSSSTRNGSIYFTYTESTLSTPLPINFNQQKRISHTNIRR